MSDVRVFKLINGEDLLAEVKDVKDSHYVIGEAASLVLSETEQGVKVGLLPYMPYAKGNIALYVTSITAEATPDDRMVDEFKRVFSPIVTPSQSIVMPK